LAAAYRRRPGAEGHISHLKRRFGWNRTRLKGHTDARFWPTTSGEWRLLHLPDEPTASPINQTQDGFGDLAPGNRLGDYGFIKSM